MPNRTLHDLFSQAVSNGADRTALICDDGREITFRSLLARAGAIAGWLDKNGVVPGDRIGLHSDVSPELIAGYLACMSRGLIAVPLDPTFPESYRQQLIQRAGTRFVLTHTPELSCEAEFVQADAGMEDGLQTGFQFGTDTPFLLMFTSGSTGVPKGVLHSHQQPVNRLEWIWRQFPFQPTDLCAARPTPGIMPSIWEIFGGLCAGHTTALMTRSHLQNPQSMLDFLAQTRATYVTLTPALLRLVLGVLEQGYRPALSLRFVTIGGERLADSLVHRFHKALPGCDLMEDYGATEVNTIGYGLREKDGRPVYAPIEGINLKITDDDQREVGVGAEGMLHVSGNSLALGYWGDPEQSEATFGGAGNGRAYKTRDRARWLQDGRFEMLGRVGTLVKINGLSVDLVEVEAALTSFNGVMSAAALKDGEDWPRLVGFITGDEGLDTARLQKQLGELLPAHMVPSEIRRLGSLPRLTSGKPDRAALALMAQERPQPVPPPDMLDAVDRPTLKTVLSETLYSITGQSLSAGDWDRGWDQLGLNSLSTVAFAQALTSEPKIPGPVSFTDLFDHPTAERLLEHLQKRTPEAPKSAEPNMPEGGSSAKEQVAITGMSICVPDANNLQAFWKMVRDGLTATPRVPVERWQDADHHDAQLRGTYLDDAFVLNAALHDLSPAEAEAADPQLRMVLRLVRTCLQDAGLALRDVKGKRVGVFMGARPANYFALTPEGADRLAPDLFLGSDEAMIAGRIAHNLDLHGPAVVVNTTCSSSLVALHMARKALEDGECDMAFVGGVCVMCDPDFLRKTNRLGVTSGSGKCRPFDEQADGFVPAEGAGVVLLEPVSAATTSHRHIYASLHGTALNHDGLSKSLTAPNGGAQRALLQSIYGKGQGLADRVAYIEAHGTGTALGDPIELEALTAVLEETRENKGVPVALGSVKANIGHSNAAAGIISLIKTALCLTHETIPPLTNFSAPNPHFSKAALTALSFPKTAHQWPAQRPLAGVSSFGMSGCNAHCILERSSQPEPVDCPLSEAVVVCVSAPDEMVLRAHCGQLAEYLQSENGSLASIAEALNRREVEECTVYVSCRRPEELITQFLRLADGDELPQPLHPVASRFAGVLPVSLPTSGEGGQAYFLKGMLAHKEQRSVSQPAEKRGRTLTEICTSVLGPQDWSALRDESFRSLGLDSIKVLAFRDALKNELDLEVSEYDLLEVAGLATLEKLLPMGSGTSNPPLADAGLNGHVARIAHVLPTIPTDPVRAPLTDLQSVYLTSKLVGTSLAERVGAWNLTAFDVLERLDLNRFRQAWTKITQRHPMLRARLTRSGQQEIVAQDQATVQVETLAPNADMETAYKRIKEALFAKAADATRSPMVDVCLLRQPGRPDRLLLAIESLIADAKSTQTLLEELWQLYDKPDLTLKPIALSFFQADALRRGALSTQDRKADLSYWQRRLAGHEGARLPCETGGETLLRSVGWMRLEKTLPEKLCLALEAKADCERVPVTTCCLSNFLSFLAQHCAQDGFIGLTVNDRPALHPDIDRIVGPFTTMMPCTFAKNRAVAPTVVHKQLVEDLRHRAFSGTEVLRHIKSSPPRIAFSGVTQKEADPRAATPVDALSVTSGLDLHCHVVRSEKGDLHLAWDVNLAEKTEAAARAGFDEFIALLWELAGEEQPAPQSALQPAQDQPSGGHALAVLNGETRQAPLTRAQRSYFAVKALRHQGDKAASYAFRVYPIASSDYDRVEDALAQVIASHGALSTLLSPSGQVLPQPCVALAEVAQLQPSPMEPRDIWFRRIEGEMGAAIKGGAWAPLRVAKGRYEGEAFVFFVFDCIALDAPSTLALPDHLFSALANVPSNQNNKEQALDYASWQNSQKAGDPGYWATKLAELPRWAATAPRQSPPGEYRMLHAGFENSDKPSRMSVFVLQQFARAIRPLAGLAGVPVLTVNYDDRNEQPGWVDALGDFTTFGLLPPGCEIQSVDAVAAELEADRRNRREDWFPRLAPHVTSERALLPAVFTDVLGSWKRPNVNPAGSAIYAGSRTLGPQIDCFIYASPQGVEVEWSYDSGVLDTASVTQAFDGFAKAVRSALPSAPKQGGQEARNWLETQNNTAAPYDQQSTMVQFFDEAARTYPERKALIDDKGSITFRELSEEVMRLAHAMQAQFNIAPGQVVAVRLERNRHLPAMLLAILRLGATFLPLNTTDPATRQSTMLERADAKLLVSDAFVEGLKAEKSVELANLLAHPKPSHFPADLSHPDGLAYIIFTSGSTGEPKGVMVRHRPVINLFEDLQKRFPLGPQDRGIWVNAVGFDLSIFDIFGLLSRGASLRIVSEVDRTDPARIAKMIAQEGITFWNSAPVYFQTVAVRLTSPRFGQRCPLRLAFLSGDWVPLDLARECLAHLPEMRLIALGGATEAVVWSNYHEVKVVPDNWTSIPYGRPIQNACYYVLDEELNPLMPGEDGDLYIGGECLSDGYINAPDLTERAFVDDPFNSGLMYHTGDRARFMDNGEIEFLGRLDGQVKIRGHRIELSEVERAMEGAGFNSPIVLATEGGQDKIVSRHLVGFHVGPGVPHGSDDLATLLPAYMVPQHLVQVSHYPTTTNGKLDRKSLLALAQRGKR
ncbi:Polyketide synthase PksN [Pseudovibrio axinellae]|uniref:Polyketide synthase PksN n=1 Tax=Pseudovibrio axinellae TaxID=989403 RepID=A0A161V0E1_9HYPH|nr:non-ribosomal peptide synthetase [Pseudovibrio axinellae]KZL09104.1 Polyketide synthase PksN [Pseudovibrio axinellae]SER75452.1 amino acid adenylation domain-containing protein [Pseudovibrio axinellae]